jgi:hypothetical protein
MLGHNVEKEQASKLYFNIDPLAAGNIEAADS